MKRSVYWVSLVGIAILVGIPLVGLLSEPQASLRDLFKLGIDLEGGTSLIYVLKPSEPGGEPPDAKDVKPVIMQRIDPAGTRGYVARAIGKHRLEIVLPGRRTRVDIRTEPLTEADLRPKPKPGAGEETPAIPAKFEPYLGRTQLVVGINPPLDLYYVRQRIEEAVRERMPDPPPPYHVVGLEAKDGQYSRIAVWTLLEQADEGLDVWKNLLTRALVGQSDVDRVKSLVAQAGFLEFRIVADRERDRGVNFDRIVRLKEAGKPPATPRFRWYPMEKGYERFEEGRLDKWNFVYVLDHETKTAEVLLDVGDGQDVTGKDLSRAWADSREAEPIVSFQMKSPAEGRFARLTRLEMKGRFLAIILDGVVKSAPTLRDVPLSRGGYITGYKGRVRERDEVVTILNSGKLAASLGDPVAERTVGPELGEDNILKGVKAITLGFALVVVFMAVYYLFAGLVADVALILNLVLIVCVMRLVHQAWTLPGVAGLILTIGMSVDANVLIFERIREEKGREGSLAFAIRRAYARAFRTILDANITTLIPAFILLLPQLATEEVKGFAVVIVVGILSSMFTALIVTRMIFEGALKLGLVKKMTMLQLVKTPNRNWMRLARGAIVVSAVAVLAGAVAFFSRGDEKYDIEFTGGTQVELALKAPPRLTGLALDAEVRRRVAQAEVLGPSTTVQRLDLEGRTEQEGIQRYLISVSSAARGPGDAGEAAVKAALLDLFKDMQPEWRRGQARVEASEITEAMIADRMGIRREDRPVARDATPQAATVRYIPPEQRRFLGKVCVLAEVTPPLTVDDARWRIDAFLKDRYPDLVNTDYRIDGRAPAEETGAYARLEIWVAVDYAGTRGDMTNPVFWGEAVRRSLGAEETFASTTTFEATLAGETRDKAVIAVVFSLIAIVLYMWFRFAKVGYGVAAVVALVHDVLITVGAVAFFSWALAGTALGNVLLITDMKINLPMVGAFLTLIGYSLNDTIVVFDRIRENRGKFGDLSLSVANRSVNQTLTRTIWTSLTTLMVVGVLYVRGGTASSLHGFSFVLALGVLVGTYSSIAIASPILVLRHYLRRVYAVAYPILGLGLLAYYALVWLPVNEFLASWPLVVGAVVHVGWLIMVSPGISAYARWRSWPLAERAPWLAKALTVPALLAAPAGVGLAVTALVGPGRMVAWAGPAAVWMLVTLPAAYGLYTLVWAARPRKGNPPGRRAPIL